MTDEPKKKVAAQGLFGHVYLQVLTGAKTGVGYLPLTMEWLMRMGAQTGVAYGHRGYLAESRNTGINYWLREVPSAEFLIQCDEDVVPCVDILGLARHDLDIVGSVCLYGGDDGPTIAGNGLPFEDDATKLAPIWPGRGLVECSWIGTGAFCISRTAAQKMFDHYGHVFTRDIDEKGERGRGIDVHFCKEARDIGLHVWLDRERFSGHYKAQVWVPDPQPDNPLNMRMLAPLAFWRGRELPKVGVRREEVTIAELLEEWKKEMKLADELKKEA